MQYRDVDLLAEKTVSDSGTESVDLDVTDPITEMHVAVNVTNGGAAVVSKIPANIITRIEIVDGGTVYYSASGPEVAALFFYDAGKYPPHWYHEVASEGQSIALPIRFGRFLGDPMRAFSPVKLRNPQLKVTWAKDSGHATGSVKLRVTAKVMADVPPPASCLLTKSVREFTTAASGKEETELPTDYPIRRLYVRAYLAANNPTSILSLFKLDCDEGRFVPFEMGVWALCEEVERAFGYASIRQTLIATNGQSRDTWTGNCLGASFSAGDGNYIANAVASGNQDVALKLVSHAGAAGSAQWSEMRAYGCLPHGVFAYPFGDPADPASWLNAPAYRKVKLTVTQGVVSALCSILTQHDRII